MPWKYKVACYLISIGPLVLVGGCEKENTGQPDPLPSSSIVEADALKANNEGVEFYKRGEYGKAITCFDVAIDTFNQRRRRNRLMRPSLGDRFTKKQHKIYSQYYKHRAQSHAAIQDYAAAIGDFSKAIEHDPEHAKLYSSRAIYYELLGSKSKAAADREKAKSLGRAK